MNYGSLIAPAASAVAVTKHDTTAQPGKALYVGGAGDVAFLTEAGDTVVFASVPAGFIIPIRFQKVLATNTSATFMVRFIEN